MEHAHPAPTPFPWRAATAVAAAVAIVELVALIAIGLMHFAPKSVNSATRAAVTTPTPATHVRAVKPKPAPQVPLRPVAKTRVLILNGNGVAGAAGAEAARLRADGYRIGGATDADRHDYSQTMVFFVPGWQKEARRLARSVGIGVVAPVDGLRPAQLKGSAVVLLLGK